MINEKLEGQSDRQVQNLKREIQEQGEFFTKEIENIKRSQKETEWNAGKFRKHFKQN